MLVRRVGYWLWPRIRSRVRLKLVFCRNGRTDRSNFFGTEVSFDRSIGACDSVKNAQRQRVGVVY